ncbi:MAG: (2Fe-2S)-binding protein [Cyanobacteria bacterium SZAS LIN-5]|nr:(2Fe-2S)-binding protein [Cyanobacteria bacterium SZAS LIN-5]
MYICSCNAVTDGQIKRCVTDEGVCTWRELMQKTKVGTQCGICAKYAFALFKELKAAKDNAAATETGTVPDSESPQR